MIVILPDPRAATVRTVTSDADTVTVGFAGRDASSLEQLRELLEYAQEGGFAVELKLLHYKGRPARLKRSETPPLKRGACP